MSLRVFLSSIIHAVLLWGMSCWESEAATNNSYTNEVDRLALLAFKSKILEDPLNIMSSWNVSRNFCEWKGVTCDSNQERVEGLDLQSKRLVGSLSPYLGNLTSLKFIYFQDNKFQGEIPQEIGRLSHLQDLNVTSNFLAGEIPSNLSHCSDLRNISLHFNDLTGKIPVQFGSLSKLAHLFLFSNSLTGGIPSSFGNLTNLETLSLGSNRLDGRIPDALSQLINLKYFGLGDNKLSGMVPQWLYNITSLTDIVIPENNFSGSLPPDIGFSLPNLHILAIGGNQFGGLIPSSLSNASGLRVLDISGNYFVQSVNINFGSLKYLWLLNLGGNHLGLGKDNDFGFLTSLTNCSNLQGLGLDENNFGGTLPNTITNLSTEVRLLAIGENHIVGSIPVGFEKLFNLALLSLKDNYFTGSIPIGIGKLQNVQKLELNNNRLSGQIPSSLGNMTQLYELNLQENKLTGNTPSSLGNLKKLQTFNLSRNNLSGFIPKEVISLPAGLIKISFAHNSLTGSLPFEIGSLKALEELDVSDNKLSGEIPSSLGDCSSLQQLYMEVNLFQGNIPSSLSSLRGMHDLDLSHNNLTGSIPKDLGMLNNLRHLNLSFNKLEGEMPTRGIFGNASIVSVSENFHLCGGTSKFHLLPCSTGGSKKHEKPHPFKIIAAVVVVLLCLITLIAVSVVLYLRRKSRRKPILTFPSAYRHLRVSYGELLKATNRFSAENLIGVGSFGSVYKGVLDSDQIVIAVKVLNLHQQGASKSFTSECEALRRIRHRNLLRIFTSCSSVDFHGNDFKALVFEFMPNGNLDTWLHPSTEGQNNYGNLSLIERLNIAIDVAFAVDYLHNNSESVIVHGDLKPSNVLLDKSMTAHVGDFGLAKVLSLPSDFSGKFQSNSLDVMGSIGYLAPEYGMGSEVSTHGDMYSCGILLLEMFTGIRPTNEMFRDSLGLHSYVKLTLLKDAMKVDSCILIEDDGASEEISVADLNNRKRKMLESVLRIGVACSLESPKERMTAKDVIVKLCTIRLAFQGGEIRVER